MSVKTRKTSFISSPRTRALQTAIYRLTDEIERLDGINGVIGEQAAELRDRREVREFSYVKLQDTRNLHAGLCEYDRNLGKFRTAIAELKNAVSILDEAHADAVRFYAEAADRFNNSVAELNKTRDARRVLQDLLDLA